VKKSFLIFLLISALGFSQTKNPDVIIKNLKEAFSKVKDYTVNVDIKVDVNVIKVPEMKAKLYYKAPDKIHIESEGFAMLPKNGLYTSPLSFLKGDYTAIFAKIDTIEDHTTSVIKIIPLNDKGDLLLTTLWVDQTKNVIRKVESATKTNGTFTLQLDYNNSIKYPLPDSMVFSFNAGKLNTPDMMGQEENQGRRRRRAFKDISGKVTINYFNYEVNKGIPDSIFEEKNDSSKNKR
jgi:outer membrane lipoprotein-sorting protein